LQDVFRRLFAFINRDDSTEDDAVERANLLFRRCGDESCLRIRMGSFGVNTDRIGYYLLTHPQTPIYNDPEEFLTLVTGQRQAPVGPIAPATIATRLSRLPEVARAGSPPPSDTPEGWANSILPAFRQVARDILDHDFGLGTPSAGYLAASIFSLLVTGSLSSGSLGMTPEEKVSVDRAVAAIRGAAVRKLTRRQPAPGAAPGYDSLWSEVSGMSPRPIPASQ
jgi:hypothetical protein